MKRLIVLAALLSGCGVDGPPVRESGIEPPTVATSVIENASTEPTKPRGTLF